MLPRFALGNWWSRFYRYNEESYLSLMDRFEQENLPFTVAVIDMDWHLVDIDPKIWKRMDRIYVEPGIIPKSNTISGQSTYKRDESDSECTSCRWSARP